MDAVQKDHWYFVVLIFLPFLKVAVQQKEVVTVRLEEGMVLDCLCPWEGNLSLVSWTRVPEKNPMAIFHPDFGLGFSHQYKGRVEFLKTTPMDGSISITNVTHQDIGMYRCSVQTFPRGSWTRNIQVEDLDEPPEENHDGDEDGADSPTPQVIVADVELVAVQNDNLTVGCNHTHNGTVYQSMLERMPHQQLWSIIGVCKKVEGGLVSEDYSDRGQVICEDSLDVHLHLTGVVQDDGGLYRCTFNTDLGMQTSTVLLTVVTQGGFSLSVYMMCIYTVAGTTGIILFVLFLILAMRQKKKKRKKNWREEYRVKLHPAQRQPNTYENVSMCPMFQKKSRPTKVEPVYANLQSVRLYKIRRQQPGDK